ncbi:MAG: alanine--tRNA ligase [Candidatus Hodarchaeota archaeon]
MSLDKKKLRKLFGPEKYKVIIFDELGFQRKQCKNCGDYFWTLNPDLEICGDTKCVGGYQFIGQSIKGSWDFHDTIKRWSEFFVKYDHKIIKEYPVVARWRNDLFFTLASITCFQPHVLNGTILPPANPLVIPQPCIRFGGKGFNDIDNVGKTGRHLTSFIMGGQHSFNNEKLKLKGYWMDRCIELDFKFLTDVLKIDPIEITLREDIWLGGGNFGPCLESFAKGLEIVNSVFMQYEVLPDQSYRQMDMTVVDVGWGMERIGWFALGTPTIYEATFGPVFEKVGKNSNINVDKELMARYAVISGLLNIDEVDNIEQARKKVASELGLTYNELESQLGPLEAAYAITDHMRTLIFAIADGAFPSNVGGGYNLRIILRRAMSLNNIYNLNLNLTELSYDLINYFKRTYDRLDNANDIIEDVLKVEKERFKESRRKGINYVKKLLKDNKKIGIDKYIELYESHGIPPELVQEIAKEEKLQVDVPGDFYVTLGEKRAEIQVVSKIETLEDKLKGKFDNLPETVQLYEKNSYISEFKAKILRIVDNKYVVLDKTLFYPTSGGQLHDTGKMSDEHVNNVEKVGNVIVHELKRKTNSLKNGQEIIGKIDWDRRIALMRHHTATHIVNYAARQVLGNHVWQGGTEKTPERAHLDISHYKAVSKEELWEIEKIANNLVLKNINLDKEEMSRNQAESNFGFTIYQGGAVPGKTLKIINIGDFDVEACGGTHLDNTNEVGSIKMIGSKRIQDGIVRLEYTAGKAAIKYNQELEKILEKSAQEFNIGKNEVPSVMKRFFNDWKDALKESERLRKELSLLIAEQLFTNSEQYKEIKIVHNVFNNKTVDDLIEIGNALISKSNDIIGILVTTLNEKVNTLIIAGSKAQSSGIHAGKAMKELTKVLGGGGGGKSEMAQGGGMPLENVQKIRNKCLEIIKKQINS